MKNILVLICMGLALTSCELFKKKKLEGAQENYTIKDMDVSSYATGLYSVVLICDGVAVDSKSLIVN